MSWVPKLEELIKIGEKEALKKLKRIFRSGKLNHAMPGSDHQLNVLKECTYAAAYFICIKEGTGDINQKDAMCLLKKKSTEILTEWNMEFDSELDDKKNKADKRMRVSIKTGLSCPQTNKAVLLENDYIVDDDQIQFGNDISGSETHVITNYSSSLHDKKQEETIKAILTAKIILIQTTFVYGYAQLERMINLLLIMKDVDRKVTLYLRNYDFKMELIKYVNELDYDVEKEVDVDNTVEKITKLNLVLGYHNVYKCNSWSMRPEDKDDYWFEQISKLNPTEKLY